MRRGATRQYGRVKVKLGVSVESDSPFVSDPGV